MIQLTLQDGRWIRLNPDFIEEFSGGPASTLVRMSYGGEHRVREEPGTVHVKIAIARTYHAQETP